MVRPLIHDPISLAVRSTEATAADLGAARDLMDTLLHHREECVGMAGNMIGVQRRIIAVADAYDAMTSRRSYRQILPQAAVRQELERGRGTQFDPEFADIMLQMMAEDPEYQMSEK